MGTLQAKSTRRALLLTALGGLLIAGVTIVLPAGADEAGRLAGYAAKAGPSVSAKDFETFNKARDGDCLTWPANAPDQATIVDCAKDHRFEIAESIDMRTFPAANTARRRRLPRRPAFSRSARSNARSR